MGSDPAWVMSCDDRFKKIKDKEESESELAAEDFPGMHKTLGSIFNTTKQEKERCLILILSWVWWYSL